MVSTLTINALSRRKSATERPAGLAHLRTLAKLSGSSDCCDTNLTQKSQCEQA